MLPFVCGTPAEWCVFVKAKIQDCLRLVCVTFETKTLGHCWKKMAVMYQDTKIFQILLNRTHAVLNIGHSQLTNIIAEITNYESMQEALAHKIKPTNIAFHT